MAILIGWNAYLAFKVHQTKARLSDEGWPADLSQLFPYYASSGEGASVRWINMPLFVWDESRLLDASIQRVEKTPPGQPLPAGAVKVIRDRMITPNGDALAALHRELNGEDETRIPYAAEDLDPDRGDPKSILIAARTLRASAYLLTEERRSDEAIDAIGDMARLGDSLQRAPNSILQLVRLRIYVLARTTIASCLERASWSDAQLQRLEKLMTRLESPPSDVVSPYLAAQRVGGLRHTTLEGLNAASPGPDKAVQDALWSLVYCVTGGIQHDRLVYLDLMARAQAACARPRHERLGALGALGPVRLGGWFGRDVEADFAKTLIIVGVRNENTCVGQLRAARVALAIERFRPTNGGALPERLGQLVPAYLEAIPDDPFDGQPLRFVKQPVGYTVYSVGVDREDNGGREVDDDGIPFRPGTDATFIVRK
jgi:hypothetical protein